MKVKRFLLLMMAVMFLVPAALADDGLGVLVAETAGAETLAQEALLREHPQAEIHLILADRDDGRDEWDLFFTEGTTVGECEVDAETYEVRKLRVYEKPEGFLTADQVVAQLIAAKGQLTVIELELDRDDGQLWYEGEARLDDKRYEFDMSVTGRIVEWERD